MKVTNSQLWQAQESGALKKLGHIGNIPFKTQLEIARLLKKAQDELQLIDGLRVKIFQKYGTAKGNIYTFPPEKTDDVNKEHGELMALDLEIPAEKVQLALWPTTITDLNALDIIALEPFVDISVQEPKEVK